jgi:hypothetical protein
MICAKELLTKCKSFDLPDLVAHILKDKRMVRDFEEEKCVENYYQRYIITLKSYYYYTINII